ncbi:MAG: D-2-hydroxyacid dehydrogenase [Lachnospiraceae bacterium]|nr:D-2-hydroxyacid dehydrogenase [Lachnospiraceae bacterium]
MKIVVLDAYAGNPSEPLWEKLKTYGETDIYEETISKHTEERIRDAEIVFTNKTPISGRLMRATPTLKFINVLSTGCNILDFETARELGIVISNCPDYGTLAVAQHTMSLLLEITNSVGESSHAVPKGDWLLMRRKYFKEEPLIELYGKTIGIIGYGNIGRAFGKLAKAFGMNILAYALHKRTDLEDEQCRYADLETIYKESDIISLHCPLTPTSEKMINAETLAKMKDGVIILNCARGLLINEADIAKALNSGKVYALGTDVASREPITEDNPLLGAKNCIITPHLAWACTETRARLIQIAMQNLDAYLAGHPINQI